MTQSLDELINRVADVYVLPEVCIRLAARLDDPDSSNREIAALIMLDPGLALRLMRVANSAYFGFPAKITSVDQALAVLGRITLARVVLGVSVIGSCDKLRVAPEDLRAHWRHSVLCGLLARRLAAGTGLDGEALFLGGLLHDVGQLVILDATPRDALSVWQEDGQLDPQRVEAVVAEAGFFHWDHALVGEALLRRWGLPELFAVIARWHRAPEQATAFGPEVAVVGLANAMSRYAADDTALSALAAAPAFPVAFAPAQLSEIRQSCEQQLEETLSCFI